MGCNGNDVSDSHVRTRGHYWPGLQNAQGKKASKNTNTSRCVGKLGAGWHDIRLEFVTTNQPDKPSEGRLHACRRGHVLGTFPLIEKTPLHMVPVFILRFKGGVKLPRPEYIACMKRKFTKLGE